MARRSLNHGGRGSGSGSGSGRNHCTTQQLVPVLLVSLFSFLYYHYYYNNPTSFSTPKLETETPSTETHMAATTSTTTSMEEEIFGVKIERNPPESKLTHLAVTSWPKWGCSPSKFPWTFTAKETMYLLEGKVKVYCDGYDGSFEIGAGDLVEFPKGMKVTWDVTEAVNKHYSLDDN